MGGKARGLKVLHQLGLKIPESFVIIHPDGHELPEDLLATHLRALGDGPKAVRSSAMSEDGVHASFAGQFASYLNVSGTDAVKAAIRKCATSASADRVSLYAKGIHGRVDTRVSVIVQNMVLAEKAGVIFTADPVTGRRDKMLIDVAEGAGDGLVGGKKDAVQYRLFDSGKDVAAQVAKNGDVLSAAQVRELMAGARQTEKSYGRPVDLEWAIDSAGAIHWLQVRPITTLDDVHFNELDDVKQESADVWSLGNIGEMMPGVVTPLTYSVCGRAIDIGLGYLAARSGVIPMKDVRRWRSLELFYNRLFFNMSRYLAYVQRLVLNKKENVLISLSATDVPELKVGKLDPIVLRCLRFLKQITTIQFAGRSVKRLRKLEQGFHLEMTGDLRRDYQTLDFAFERLADAFAFTPRLGAIGFLLLDSHGHRDWQQTASRGVRPRPSCAPSRRQPHHRKRRRGEIAGTVRQPRAWLRGIRRAASLRHPVGGTEADPGARPDPRPGKLPSILATARPPLRTRGGVAREALGRRPGATGLHDPGFAESRTVVEGQARRR